MFSRFLADARGNIAATFALMIVPIVGFAGVSIDYGRSVATRTSLQNAIDATALMLSGDIKKTPTMTAAAIQTRGEQYFNAQFKGRFARNAVVTTTYSTASSATGGLYKINIAATANVDMTVAQVLGPNVVQVGSDAEIVWGIKRLELALALDNTGSMDDNNKMVELKKAVRSLLNTLYDAAQKIDDVKVAIIPFATDVNVGTGNIAANWLNWAQWDSDNRVCTSYTWYGSCASTSAASHSLWNGCVWDRDQSYDVNDNAPSGTVGQFQPHQSSTCPVSMLGLTDMKTPLSWTPTDLNNTTAPVSVLAQKVNSMQPSGNTNVTIGMAWAWHALTKTVPLTQASDPALDLDKVVILLTDGDNTQNRWSSNGNTIDARTALVCSNAKATGIKIYTIRVINGDADLLRACATNTSMYYEVSSAAQLNNVFLSIAQNLASLRISK